MFGSADGSTPPSDRWAELERLHANKQRPLWASCSAQRAVLPYVSERAAPPDPVEPSSYGVPGAVPAR
ncbi:hypothetical protein [Streptomyces canus]|uniref:hypothetical protein n=1 Tax=Streptomyces canus TaxID=58343 RepID=UPI003F6D066B